MCIHDHRQTQQLACQTNQKLYMCRSHAVNQLQSIRFSLVLDLSEYCPFTIGVPYVKQSVQNPGYLF